MTTEQDFDPVVRYPGTDDTSVDMLRVRPIIAMVIAAIDQLEPIEAGMLFTYVAAIAYGDKAADYFAAVTEALPPVLASFQKKEPTE